MSLPVCVSTHRNCRDPDGLHGGVGEQVPQGGPYLRGNQVVGGARDRRGYVLYGFSGHVMNYGIVLKDTR